MTKKFVNIGEIDVFEISGVTDTIQNLIRRGKLWMFEKLATDKWWADLFGMITKADYSKSSPISPSGIVSVIKDYMYRTVDIASIVGEEIGSESIMEMLSEGLSSALETNFNGALQKIMNVWKGSLPSDLSYALSLGQRLDRVDRLYALSQIAPIGHSPEFILEALVSGADVRLRDALSTNKQQYIELVTAKNTVMIEHLTQLHNFIANLISELVFWIIGFIDRIDGLMSAIAQEHMARLNQLEDNLEANKLRYDYGMIDSTKFEQRLNEINVDVESTKNTWEAWINRFDGIIADIVDKISLLKDKIVNVIKKYLEDYEVDMNTVINLIADNVINNTLDTDLKNKALELYEDLKAYRKSGFNYS